MKPVEMYTTSFCGYCTAARRLLEERDIPYREIDVSGQWEIREQMMERAGGRRTVPQIFAGKTHIGGYQELSELDRQGRLLELVSKT